MIFFRFPFEKQIYTVQENSRGNNISFVSFNEEEQLDFEGEIVPCTTQQISENPLLSSNINRHLKDFISVDQNEYEEKVEDVMTFIKEHHLSKLVFSRVKLVELKSETLNLSQTFFNLCKAYENAFVYLFNKSGSAWIGAFSELLGEFNKETSEFKTMSLAGTTPVSDLWTRKEIEEQQPVTAYIQSILSKYSTNIQVSETYDHHSGNIKHLRNDFKTNINRADLDQLISDLHPTPAVCGIPKELCRNAIQQFEDVPRNFYSGYIKVETAHYIHYYVNLRCAEIFKNAALIHVGGGVTSESIPQKEWKETELKAEAIVKNLSFNN